MYSISATSSSGKTIALYLCNSPADESIHCTILNKARSYFPESDADGIVNQFSKRAVTVMHVFLNPEESWNLPVNGILKNTAVKTIDSPLEIALSNKQLVLSCSLQGKVKVICILLSRFTMSIV